MLNRDEERQLRDIEMSLTREDPRFAERITVSSSWDEGGLTSFATALAVLGCSLAVLGLLLGSVLGLFGVLLAVVGFALRLTPMRSARPPRARGDDDGEAGTGHDGALI